VFQVANIQQKYSPKKRIIHPNSVACVAQANSEKNKHFVLGKTVTMVCVKGFKAVVSKTKRIKAL
jgi:hypothetical protein